MARFNIFHSVICDNAPVTFCDTVFVSTEKQAFKYACKKYLLFDFLGIRYCNYDGVIEVIPNNLENPYMNISI